MDLLWFVLTAFGLTQILLYGSIFDFIRPEKNLDKKWTILFHCPMCMGFWVGAFLFLINEGTELFTVEYTSVNLFICGWLSSGTSYLIMMAVDDSGIKLNIGDKNELDPKMDA